MEIQFNKQWIFFTILLLCFLAGCSSVNVKTDPPTNVEESSILSLGKVSSVNVRIDTQKMHNDQIVLLKRNQVPDLIKNSMITSLKDGNYFDDSGSYTVDILISNFIVTSSFRTFSQVFFSVSVKDAAGKEVKNYVTDSRSIRGGSTADRMTRILSQASQRALNLLCERNAVRGN